MYSDWTEFHKELDEKLHIPQKYCKRSQKIVSLNLLKCNNLPSFNNFCLLILKVS